MVRTHCYVVVVTVIVVVAVTVIVAVIRMMPPPVSSMMPTVPTVPAERIPRECEITPEIVRIIISRIYVDAVSVVFHRSSCQ